METIKLFFIFTLIQFARYILVAGGAYVHFWVRKHPKQQSHRIQHKEFTKEQIRHELSSSITTAFIFAFIITLFANPYVLPKTKIYHDITPSNMFWTFISPLVLLILHDTYFYWMHRSLHHPRLFKLAHRVHHFSKNPSPLAAYSFHPIEALLEIIWMVPVVFLIPIHQTSLLIFSFATLLMNVLGHLGLELYPATFKTHPILKWMNTSTQHNEHHRLNNGHFGLYFVWWDRWMKTEKIKGMTVPSLLLTSMIFGSGCGVYSSMRPADTLKQGKVDLSAGASANVFGLPAFVGNVAVGATDWLELTGHYETYSGLGGARFGILHSNKHPLALALGFESGLVHKPELRVFSENSLKKDVVYVPSLTIGKSFPTRFGAYELYGSWKVFLNNKGYDFSTGKLGNRFLFKDRYFVGLEAGATHHLLKIGGYWWVAEGGIFAGLRL